jgi:DNA polymerase-3 subunit alpha
MSYFPLHCHSHYSLLDGLSRGAQLAERAHKIGCPGIALTDHGTLAGTVSFLKAMKGACARCGRQENQHYQGGPCDYARGSLKPILGCEFYVCQKDAAYRDKDNGALSHLCVLAKNRDGWRGLIQASSASNRPDLFYRKPRLDLDRLAGFARGQWVVFSGHLGSDLANVCFAEPKLAYRARSYEEAKALAKPWPQLKKDLLALAGRYQELFGKGNFYLETQLIDADNLPASVIVAKALRWAAKQLGIPCVATPDAHYPGPEDAADQRIQLCSALGTTLKEVGRRLAAAEDVMLGAFFQSNRYHVPTPDEMAAIHEPDELLNTLRAAEQCEAFDITGPPQLPQFPCDRAPAEHLRALCEAGWRRKVEGRVPREKWPAYRGRLESELKLFNEVGLAPYFLIVEDVCRYAHEQLGCKTMRGRGSAMGCLITHLLNIGDCDPIEHGLLVERFYNAGRNTPGKPPSLPDIDMDFPVGKRERVVAYARAKYGEAHVCQMATYGRIQGKGALTEVLRAHDWGAHDERKAITAHIPDEAKIADQLQEMREAGVEPSIIRWALEHNAKELAPWCEEKDGQLTGPLAPYFAQAMRLEGVKKSQSKHAAGVIISPTPLADSCPMLFDKSTGRLIAAFEYTDLESMGFVKFDFLGIACLDKLQGALHTVRTGLVA